MDNPVQTECSTGLRNQTNRNYVVVQPKTFILAVNVLNCYAVRCGGISFTPCCTSFARGYPY
ncbi:MAG: hypothetical protein LBL39_00145 [Planctomycetaceae bacterium]|nr:hypothetical protein [Planctomycetaceae bacterium]